MKLAQLCTPKSWKQQIPFKQAQLEAAEYYNPVLVNPCFIGFAFGDPCPILSQLCWLHAFHWCCNRNCRHLFMTSPTACFYFSSFEVPLIIYDPLRDSKTCPPQRPLHVNWSLFLATDYYYSRTEPSQHHEQKWQIFIFGQPIQRK